MRSDWLDLRGLKETREGGEGGKGGKEGVRGNQDIDGRQRETEKEDCSNGSENRNWCFAPGSLQDIYTRSQRGKVFPCGSEITGRCT